MVVGVEECCGPVGRYGDEAGLLIKVKRAPGGELSAHLKVRLTSVCPPVRLYVQPLKFSGEMNVFTKTIVCSEHSSGPSKYNLSERAKVKQLSSISLQHEPIRELVHDQR
jgi:hypothetical protein